MASGDREISSRLGGVTVSRVSPSHSQAVVPPQVIHKSNRRGTRLPVTHNKEVTNNARNFFLLFFLSFFLSFFLFFHHRAQQFSSCVFCLSPPPLSLQLRLLVRFNSDQRTPRYAIAEKLSEKAVCSDFFPFFLPLSFFFFLRSEVCVGRGILDTWIDKWKRFEEQLNCR